MSLTPQESHPGSIYGGRPRATRMKSLSVDGKNVHIAVSPEEALNLRQRLETIKADEPFDLVISGSPEHLEALRKAHELSSQRRQLMREQHGEAYDEWERVREELDILSNELHMMTEHGVALNANFSRFGYDAHLRTYDDEPPQSSHSSIYGHDESEDQKDWEAEKSNGRTFKLVKKPVVRQYFHQGLLWRASKKAEVATYELFVDLLYVGIIAINGDTAAENPTGEELLRYAITFIMSWRIFTDLSVAVAWFFTEDLLQRLAVLFVTACLVGLTTNMIQAFDETYSQLVAFYLAARLFTAAYYFVLSFVVPMVRNMMIMQGITICVPSILWIGSIYVEDFNSRIAIIWVALMIDLFGGVVAIIMVRGSKLISSRLATWAERVFEFYPATNIEHKTERTNSFVTLILGYSVVALLYQNTASFGVNAFFGKAVLGLVQAFCLNTLYFEIDSESLYRHAIRRNVLASVIWVSVHLPFLLGYSLAGAALSKLVVAHDSTGADVDALTPTYANKSEEEVSMGLRWFYCGGLGVALLCMGVINLTHVHKDLPGGNRIRKGYRLAVRFAISVIMFCLPIAHDLNSLNLISITTSLITFVLFLEIYGASCATDSFIGDKEQCKYTARCKMRKKDLENAVKSGEVVNVKTLKGGENGMYELS